MSYVSMGLQDLLGTMDGRKNVSSSRHIPDNVEMEPRAVRMLPLDHQCLGIHMDGPRLLVAFTQPPTPAEVYEVEVLAGVKISVGLPSSHEAMQELRFRAERLHILQPGLTERLLDISIERLATDLHLSVGDVPKIRVGGTLQQLPDQPVLSKADINEVAAYLATPDRLAAWNPEHDVDCAAPYAGWRLRISLYYQMRSQAIAIRFIPRNVLSMDDLGVPPICAKIVMENHNGLVLVCGITGSGKSTTLAAMVDLLNSQRSSHILTIEDPVEYVHQNKMATVHQREIGVDTPDFATALKHALRQDPDIILVGEMRDTETMQMALDAAETGHLVLATVHSRDASNTIPRIVSSFPSDQQNHVRTQLADSLVGVVVQSLLPAANDPTAMRLVCEIMVPNAAIRSIIRENKMVQLYSAIQGGAKEGMQVFDRDLARAVLMGNVRQEVARSHARRLDEFESYLKDLRNNAQLLPK